MPGFGHLAMKKAVARAHLGAKVEHDLQQGHDQPPYLAEQAACAL